MARSEIREVLERAIDELPDGFRAVFVARVVEGMSVEETAELFALQAGDGEDAAAPRARPVARRARPAARARCSPRSSRSTARRCERMTEA